MKNVVCKNMLIGATLGAVLSLLHKPTRNACGEKVSEAKRMFAIYRKNPELLTEQTKQKLDEVKDAARTVSENISFINGQIEELRKTTPKVIELIEETKEHFSKNTPKRLE